VVILVILVRVPLAILDSPALLVVLLATLVILAFRGHQEAHPAIQDILAQQSKLMG
jgi:hypothetical protein